MMGMLRKFIIAEGGAFTAIFFIMIPVLIAGIGLAVDIGFWLSTKRDLQNAADAGAVAGAYELLRTESQVAAEAEAELIAADNMIGPVVVLTTFPADNRIQVSVEAAATPFFLGSFINNLPTIRATALAELTAENAVTPPACLNLLAPSGQGLHLNGNVTVDTSIQTDQGCGIHINSEDEDALNIEGNSAELISEDICVHGGVQTNGTGEQISSTPKTGCPQISNPYAHLEAELENLEDDCPETFTEEIGAATGSGQNKIDTFEFGSEVFEKKLTVNSQVTVDLVSDDPIKMCFDLEIKGQGTLNLRAHLIFVNGARLNVNGGGNLNIFAPDTETPAFEGLSIISSETNNAPSPHEINGGGTLTIEAGRGISIPGDSLSLSGNSELFSEAVSITAQDVEVSGTASFRIGANPQSQPVPNRPGSLDSVHLIN